MDPKQIMQSNLLDILFEGRNKNYGAYPLRKYYPERVKKSLGIMFLFCGAVCLATFISSWRKAGGNAHLKVDNDIVITQVDMTKKVDPPKPQPPQTHQMKTVAVTPPLIVPDIQVTKTIHTIEEQTNAVIATIDHVGDTSLNMVVNGDPGSPQKTAETPAVVTPEPDPNTPIDMAEVMPEFPGGRDGLMRFWQRHLEQPELEDGITKVVKVQFIVSPNGQIIESKIIQSGGQDLDNNVEHAVSKMPYWKPGFQNGRNVAVRFVQSVTFTGSGN